VLLGLSVFFAVAGHRNAKYVTLVYVCLAANMTFNLAFPLLMFRARNLTFSMVVTWMTLLTAVFLFVFVSATPSASDTSLTLGRFRMNRLSPWLLLPYIVWLIFAAVLASDVLLMNSGATERRD